MEELDGGPTPFQTFAVQHWRQWDFEFFHLYREGSTAGGVPWQYHRGSRAHALNFFECAEIRITRETDDFRQTFGIFCGEMGQGTVTKILSLTPLGSPYNAIEILTLTPNNFQKLGKNFRGGGPGPLGQKGRGLPQT